MSKFIFPREYSLAVTSHWRERQREPPKHWYPTTAIQGVTTHKTSTWSSTAVETSKLVPTHSAKVKNVWSSTSTPLYAFIAQK